LKGDSGECAVMVPLTSVLLVEYATDAEVEKMQAELKKKADQRARSLEVE